MAKWATPVRTRLIPEEDTFTYGTALLEGMAVVGFVGYIEFADGTQKVFRAAAQFGTELKIPDGCTVDEAKAMVEALLALEDNRE